MASPQADALLRHILRACGKNAQRRALIAEAFKLARSQDAGTGNAIGDLELICVRFVAEKYADAHMAALRAVAGRRPGETSGGGA